MRCRVSRSYGPQRVFLLFLRYSSLVASVRFWRGFNLSVSRCERIRSPDVSFTTYSWGAERTLHPCTCPPTIVKRARLPLELSEDLDTDGSWALLRW